MYRYQVTLNGTKKGVVTANTYNEALGKAISLYGLETDVREI